MSVRGSISPATDWRIQARTLGMTIDLSLFFFPTANNTSVRSDSFTSKLLPETPRFTPSLVSHCHSLFPVLAASTFYPTGHNDHSRTQIKSRSTHTRNSSTADHCTYYRIQTYVSRPPWSGPCHLALLITSSVSLPPSKLQAHWFLLWPKTCQA